MPLTRKKNTRHRGSHTHSRGAKKKARGKGHRGGIGMAGSGKRGDQKKTLILKKFGNSYFGKRIALRRIIIKRPESINLKQIQKNINSFVTKGIAKESKGSYEINLSKYKILSEGEFSLKANITADSASKAAIEKVKKAGGEIKTKLKEEKSEAATKEE